MKKQIFAGAAGLALVAGCSPEVTRVSQAKAVYSNTFHEGNSEWSIACYGPTKSVEAKSGDILLRLVLNNTDLVQPVALGQSDVPQELYLRAVAEINDLDNPDQIIAGESYQIPERCQPE